MDRRNQAKNGKFLPLMTTSPEECAHLVILKYTGDEIPGRAMARKVYGNPLILNLYPKI
jgi:hypothetical protein